MNGRPQVGSPSERFGSDQGKWWIEGDKFCRNWVSPSLQFRSLAIGIGSSDDDAVGNRSDNDSLLGESVEEQPPGS